VNILQVTTFFYPDSVGGSNRVVFEISKGLAARGHNVHLLTRRIDKGFPVHEEIEGIHVHRYEAPGKRWLIHNFHAVINIPRLFRELSSALDFDLIHYHDVFSSLGINLATLGKRIPKVATNYSLGYIETLIENPPEAGGSSTARLIGKALVKAYARVIKGIERWNLSQAAKIIVLSDFSRDHLRRFLGFREEDIVIIPGGVDLDTFHPGDGDRPALKKALGLEPDRPLLFTVRRLAYRMGLDNLIKAMVEVRKRRPDVLLIIGGGGHLRDMLQELVMRLNLEDNVRLIGLIDEEKLPIYYQAADLFILPTQALEGFGLITLEALACGCPVLGTPVGNTPDLLRPLDPGLIMGGTDPQSMATAIADMLAAREKLEALRGRCAGYARQNFSWDKAVVATERVLTEICGKFRAKA